MIKDLFLDREERLAQYRREAKTLEEQVVKEEEEEEEEEEDGEREEGARAATPRSPLLPRTIPERRASALQDLDRRVPLAPPPVQRAPRTLRRGGGGGGGRSGGEEGEGVSFVAAAASASLAVASAFLPKNGRLLGGRITEASHRGASSESPPSRRAPSGKGREESQEGGEWRLRLRSWKGREGGGAEEEEKEEAKKLPS